MYYLNITLFLRVGAVFIRKSLLTNGTTILAIVIKCRAETEGSITNTVWDLAKFSFISMKREFKSLVKQWYIDIIKVGS